MAGRVPLLALEVLVGLLAGGVPVGVAGNVAPAPMDAVGRVEGRVLSASTSAPIPGARLRIDSLDVLEHTDRDGGFVLAEIPGGRWSLRVDAEGYGAEEIVIRVPAAGTVRLDLELSPAPSAGRGTDPDAEDPVRLPELHVFGRIADASLRLEAPSAWVVDSSRIDAVPVAVERDIFRAFQTLPSATPLSDYSSALLVRGGTPSQTRVHLDGIPLHNPFHLGGFVSTFTAEATGTGVLRPGGLPASVPSSLSGIMEVRTRRPGRDSLRARGSFGLLSSNATFDGPLPGGRGGFLLSARRTYVDVATRGLDALGVLEDPLPYAFSDLLVRMERDAGERSGVSLTGHLNREGLSDPTGPFDAGWGSDALGLRFRSLVGDRTSLEVGAATSGFGGDYFTRDRELALDGTVAFDTSRARGSVRTWALDGTVTTHADDHVLQGGVRWERNSVDHDLAPDEFDAEYIPTLRETGAWGSAALFVRDRWSPGPWTFDVGVRGERPLGRSLYLLPRARAGRDLGSGWSLAVAGGTYVQDWWGLRNREAVLADVIGYDLLVRAPAEHPPSRGWDVVLEARGRIGGFDVRADAYRRKVRNVPTPLPVPEPGDEQPAILAPDSVLLGETSVFGIELAASGRLGATSLALSYRFQHERSSSRGMTFRPRSERPHRLTLVGTLPWGGRDVSFGLTWMSGIPFTPVRAVVPGIVGATSDGRPAHPGRTDRLAFGELNGGRLPSYLRLDVSARGPVDVDLFGLRGELEPYVSVLNVLNRHNAFYAEYDVGSLETVMTTLWPQFPVLPSFGFRWRF